MVLTDGIPRERANVIEARRSFSEKVTDRYYTNTIEKTENVVSMKPEMVYYYLFTIGIEGREEARIFAQEVEIFIRYENRYSSSTSRSISLNHFVTHGGTAYFNPAYYSPILEKVD